MGTLYDAQLYNDVTHCQTDTALLNDLLSLERVAGSLEKHLKLPLSRVAFSRLFLNTRFY